MPLISNAQSDFNFLIENGKIIWVKDSVFVNPEIDIKSRLIEKLESIDGVEIINSYTSNIIRGNMNGVLFANNRRLGMNVHETFDCSFRIEILQGCYCVKLSSFTHFINGIGYSYEFVLLKKRGTKIDNEKFKDMANQLFSKITKID